MMKAYALFGIKATTNWKGKVYNARTNEVYNGVTTNISAYFRAYDSFQESIKDYFDLICNLDRYKKAKNCKNRDECIKAISHGGYATDPNYSNLILKIIELYDLHEYDYRNLDTYLVGKDYKLLDNMYVRKNPEIKSNNIKKYIELTEDGKKHAKYTNDNDNAILLKDTIITCIGVCCCCNGDVWIEIPSGYIAGINCNIVYVGEL